MYYVQRNRAEDDTNSKRRRNTTQFLLLGLALASVCILLGIAFFIVWNSSGSDDTDEELDSISAGRIFPFPLSAAHGTFQHPKYCDVSTEYKPRIAIVGLHGGKKHQIMYDYTACNKQEYASQHGYTLQEFAGTLDNSRPTQWSKLIALRQVLQSGSYDWAWWTDADVIIANHAIQLESVLCAKNVDFIVPIDEKGFINSGSFLVRATPTAIKMLDHLFNQYPVKSSRGWQDQAAMIKVFLELFYKMKDTHDSAASPSSSNLPLAQIEYVPMRLINSHAKNDHPGSRFQPNDFVLHVPGCVSIADDLNECLDWIANTFVNAAVPLPQICEQNRYLAKKRPELFQ